MIDSLPVVVLAQERIGKEDDNGLLFGLYSHR